MGVDAAARLMEVLPTTSENVLSRIFQGGGGGGGVRQVVQGLGVELTAPHIDKDRVEASPGTSIIFQETIT